MAVGYTAKDDSFAAGKAPGSPYDLAPDGERLAPMLADDADGQKEPTPLTLLLTFFDELRRRAPASAPDRGGNSVKPQLETCWLDGWSGIRP